MHREFKFPRKRLKSQKSRNKVHSNKVVYSKLRALSLLDGQASLVKRKQTENQTKQTVNQQ